VSTADRRGDRIVLASWAGTALFALTAGLAAAVRAAAPLALAVALLLFVAGTACYAVALVGAVGRSRADDISVSGLFFLMGGVAPRPVTLHVWASFCTEVTAAVATAAVRVNSSLAFGILAPVYGLSLMALWGARHGTFPPRPARRARAARQARRRR
jgi:hypothetical protein